MKSSHSYLAIYFLLFLLLATNLLTSGAKTCNPSGKIRGKEPPPGQCNPENHSDCCKQGKLYTPYKCSPRVSGHTKAVLTLNSFEKGRRWRCSLGKRRQVPLG
ncbi:hypothetical protein PanWU01x14_277040 [Parasponia andersonii]|uniref:Uncharacterized protein n=1 Tax=Parasponia andersonii TaxID=3476 RepID=A0A2P5B2M4_PARAD|nr:hypothetical protein PanWU01x14_277040 [Parasponia andersonii]